MISLSLLLNKKLDIFFLPDSIEIINNKINKRIYNVIIYES